MSALDGKTNWVNYLRQHYKEKVLIAEAYIKFAKKERWQYEVAEIEEDIITFKAALCMQRTLILKYRIVRWMVI